MIGVRRRCSWSVVGLLSAVLVAACGSGGSGPTTAGDPVPEGDVVVAPAEAAPTEVAPAPSVEDTATGCSLRVVVPEAAAGAEPPTGDDSQPCAADEGAAYLIWPDDATGDRTLCGPVAEIRPPTEEYGIGAYATVVLEGDGPVEQRSFLALTAASPGLPFAVGDRLVVRIKAERMGIHGVNHGTVTGADGRLLLAFSGDGAAEHAPGWTFEVLEVAREDEPTERGRAPMQYHAVALAHAGKRALIRPDRCRRLSTSDGEFVVTGGSVTYGPGLRVPDSSEYSTYSILRSAP